MKTNFLVAKALPLAILIMTSVSAWADDTNNGVHFPDLNRSYLKTGDFVGPDHIRRINNGLNKDQVSLQIGNPHFSEGIGNPDVWNYAFNFYTGKSDEYVTCQYQVQYDREGRVKATYWRDSVCERYLDEKKVVVNQSHPITINADGLFAFGRYGFSDLEPKGRENLHNLAGQIKSGYKTLQAIDVVGHTDRIGSPEANMKLSIARANTIKQYFIDQGIPAGLIRAQGAGASKPLVFCQGNVDPAVIACLMPNRRIEVTVNGDI